jgi:hypothetical protein
MRPHCIVVGICLATAGSPASVSGGRLEQWKREAGELSGGTIEVLRIGGGSASQANPQPLPEVAARALSDASFRQNLAAAHALTVNWEGPPRAHYVLLNMALAGQWKDAEEGLLAHEIGHIWLNARGFRSPPFEPGPRACLGILAGDIPQHILIRAEIERRGISGSRYWLGNLELAMQLTGKSPPKLEPCQKLVVLSQWMDARLGATPDTWAEWECFEALQRKIHPWLLPYADTLENLLRGADLRTPAGFAGTVERVRTLLESGLDARY